MPAAGKADLYVVLLPPDFSKHLPNGMAEVSFDFQNQPRPAALRIFGLPT